MWVHQSDSLEFDKCLNFEKNHSPIVSADTKMAAEKRAIEENKNFPPISFGDKDATSFLVS